MQPVSGRLLKTLPEGQHADDLRVVYTATALLTRTPTNDPDRITIGAERYDVFKVEQFDHFGETHYRAFVSRMVQP